MLRSATRLAVGARAPAGYQLLVAAGFRATASPAAAEVVPATDSPFLRFGTPEPHVTHHKDALGYVPATQVRPIPAKPACNPGLFVPLRLSQPLRR